MHTTQALALLPLVLIGVAAIIVMLGIAVRRSHAMTLAITLVGLAAAFASVCEVAHLTPVQVSSLLLIDRYALFYQGLIIATAAAIAVLSYGYFQKHDGQREELYLLLLLATFGCAVLVASVHFISFFLGLEILSVSLYGMVAYFNFRHQSLEAGIKYLILGSASAAFLLFGMALIYADTGSMVFSRLTELSFDDSNLALVLPGVALTVTSIGFKLGVVPFHLWIPDVYQGAPAPVSAFVATASKTAIVALLVRFLPGATSQNPAVYTVFFMVAVASMCAGNLLALRQTNVKRILAYSSIAHFGYILVAFLAGSVMGPGAVSFYLVAYTLTTLVAFGVVTVLSGSAEDLDELENYCGLFWRRPLLASAFTVSLLSLAGIPATVGFLGKFYILAAGASASAWALMIVLVLTSIAGLFYYLRIVVTLYSSAPEAIPTPGVSWDGALLLSIIGMVLLWFGVYPAPLLNLIRASMEGIT